MLLIEILKILPISVRAENQDLGTVTGEMEGGISWPWVYLGSFGCSLPVGAELFPVLLQTVLPEWNGICTTNALLVIMAWVSLAGKGPEQFLQLPSCLCSGHGKCEVEESKTRF